MSSDQRAGRILPRDYTWCVTWCSRLGGLLLAEDECPGLADLKVGVEVVFKEEPLAAELANVVLLSRVDLNSFIVSWIIECSVLTIIL